MSDREWYEGLSREELAGIHVHVTFSNGTMDGCLNLHGQIPYWAEDDDLKYVEILEQIDDRTWHTATGVESVSLVWDERDWEKLGLADYDKTDAIVVNGHLLMARADPQKERFCASWRTVPFFAVSCALRRKYKLPTKPGTYRAFDGTLLILLEIKLPTKWMYVSKDFTESGIFIGDEQIEDYLPLVPVHFVNGRA